MARKTMVTSQTENLVAYHTLKSGSDILTKRIDRKYKPLASSVYERLVKGQRISEGAPVAASYRFEDKEKARTLKEGIDEFSKRYPEYGEILNGIIAETRTTKRRYLVFGQTSDLPEEVYSQVLDNVGIPPHLQRGLVENIRKVSEQFSKKRKDGMSEILIK